MGAKQAGDRLIGKKELPLLGSVVCVCGDPCTIVSCLSAERSLPGPVLPGLLLAAGMAGPLAVAKPVSLPRHSLNGILKPFSQACLSVLVFLKTDFFTWSQTLQAWARLPPLFLTVCPLYTASSPVAFLCLLSLHSATLLFSGCGTLPSLPLSQEPIEGPPSCFLAQV